MTARSSCCFQTRTPRGVLFLESRYFVRLNGRIYPPKQVIAAAPQIPPGDFITTDATRVLRNLGYKIERQTDDAVEKPAIVRT